MAIKQYKQYLAMAIVAMLTLVGTQTSVASAAEPVNSGQQERAVKTADPMLTPASAGKSSMGEVTVTAHVDALAFAAARATSRTTSRASAYSKVGAQLKVRAATGRCIWRTGLNSVGSGGSVHFYPDGVKSYICKLKKPVRINGRKVQWIKRGGGTTGRNCGNYFIPKSVPKTKAQVLDVKSGSWAKVKVFASASASVSARVNVGLSFEYNGKTYVDTRVVDVADATDTARSSATVRFRVTNRTRIKATGQAIAKAKAKAESKAKAKAESKAYAKAKAQAKARVDLRITIPIEGPVVPEVCPPGEIGTPPNCHKPPVDRAPQVSQVLPAHLYVGGNAYVWVEAYDPDGDPVSINILGSGAGWIAGIIPMSIRWDGSPCPAPKQCFRATAWAGQTPGTFTVTTTATAGGKSTSISGNFPVMADDFGGW